MSVFGTFLEESYDYLLEDVSKDTLKSIKKSLSDGIHKINGNNDVTLFYKKNLGNNKFLFSVKLKSEAKNAVGAVLAGPMYGVAKNQQDERNAEKALKENLPEYEKYVKADIKTDISLKFKKKSGNMYLEVLVK